MGIFRVIKFYLKAIYETFLAYTVTGLLFVGGKNTDWGKSGLLNLNSINIFGDKVACWKDLILFERDLIAVARIKAW